MSNRSEFNVISVTHPCTSEIPLFVQLASSIKKRSHANLQLNIVALAKILPFCGPKQTATLRCSRPVQNSSVHTSAQRSRETQRDFAL